MAAGWQGSRCVVVLSGSVVKFSGAEPCVGGLRSWVFGRSWIAGVFVLGLNFSVWGFVPQSLGVLVQQPIVSLVGRGVGWGFSARVWRSGCRESNSGSVA